tara:strand:- start:45 stop:302 length:258 start_codon:yes stop_codon:yes gene_type:complete
MIRNYLQEQIVDWDESFIESQILEKKFSFELISIDSDKPKEFIAFVVNQTLSMDKESSHLTIRLDDENIEKEISLINIKKMELIE